MPQPSRVTLGNRRELGSVRVIAGEQHGVVGRAQLLATELDGSAIDRALRAGRLHRIHRGVYATVAPELLTEEGHLLAALLAAGDRALLSHGTAAWRWRIFPASPSVIELAVPRTRAAPAGVNFFESRHLRAGDITHNGRFATTTVSRTLLDLATRYDRRAWLRALAEAEFQHDLRPPDDERPQRRGHPGSANLRAALREHAPGHGEMKSRLERRFRDLLIRRGIELPERNQPVGPWTVDCLGRERRVAVELAGRQHQRPHQADSDDDRDLRLRRHGYVTRRYGKRQIEERPDDVIADLVAALSYAAAGVPLRLL
jgi:very-short-patch-repair endonuclease/predicted transcriptional regulator of viral defense system